MIIEIITFGDQRKSSNKKPQLQDLFIFLFVYCECETKKVSFQATFESR